MSKMRIETTNNYEWLRNKMSGAAFKYGLPILVCIWGLIFLSPLAFFTFMDVPLTIKEVFMNLIMPCCLILKFFLNYTYFTKVWMQRKSDIRFWSTSFCINFTMSLLIQLIVQFAYGDQVTMRVHIFYFLRDFINLTVVGGFGVAIKMMIYIKMHEHERELQDKEAELRTVKKDISPHFLLNTLNNIYALTAFDTMRAQEAIIELSNLLRTLLYNDANQPKPLAESIRFMKSYVKLMQLRMPANVKINVDVDVPENSKVMIAQMLIVPLVENAFKHGIHPVKESFIDIQIHATNEKVEINVSNSNFPKNDKDKSGHGIGLQQEQTRLDIIYPGRYKWTKGTNDDKTIYTSNLTLYI